MALDQVLPFEDGMKLVKANMDTVFNDKITTISIWYDGVHFDETAETDWIAPRYLFREVQSMGKYVDDDAITHLVKDLLFDTQVTINIKTSSSTVANDIHKYMGQVVDEFANKVIATKKYPSDTTYASIETYDPAFDGPTEMPGGDTIGMVTIPSKMSYLATDVARVVVPSS